MSHYGQDCVRSLLNTKTLAKALPQGPEGSSLRKVLLVRRRTHSTDGNVDGHSKSDPNKETLIRRVDYPGDNTDHLAVAVQQRAARIPGVHCRIDLDQTFQLPAATLWFESAIKTRDHPCAHRAV